ncbi:MAG TPA: hypothetical protein VGQ46_05445 [Thermoanaerobaculia bacterium]|nr:hypothetical protein [Thermoanaerobaculia bacterium]
MLRCEIAHEIRIIGLKPQRFCQMFMRGRLKTYCQFRERELMQVLGRSRLDDAAGKLSDGRKGIAAYCGLRRIHAQDGVSHTCQACLKGPTCSRDADQRPFVDRPQFRHNENDHDQCTRCDQKESCAAGAAVAKR